MSTSRTILRSALLGLACGCRATSGLLALTVTTPADERRRGLRALKGTRATAIAAVLSAGELTVDKLPGTPSRTEPGGLAGRAVSAVVCGAALARRADERRLAGPALAALAGAAGGTFGGAWWRRTGAARLGLQPLVAALVEDAVAEGVAYAACAR